MPSHSKQMVNTKQNTSVMKVKQKNKRRNRKKKKQRIQYPIHEMQKMTNTVHKSRAAAASSGNNAKHDQQMAVAQMWAKTYEKMIRLQFQHRIQYWKNLAMNQNTEISQLKEKLERNCKYDDEMDSTETSAPSTSQEESEESESYLKFLEITLRHRQQRMHSLEKVEDGEDSD